MREGEGRHGRDSQRQEYRQQRDDQRVEDLQPIAFAKQDIAVVGPLPFGRNAEGVDAQVSQRLEAAERGGEQRDKHDGRNQAQRYIKIKLGLQRHADGSGCVSHGA
ncbi:hypothetical protein D3C80_185400 [compost metagenome]